MTTSDRHQLNRQRTRLRRQRQAKRRDTARWKQRIANSVAIAVATLCVFGARSLFAEPADVLDTSGTVSEAKAPDATTIEVGNGSVSTQTGAFQYSFPIAVPPGRMGVQPSISLSYSSQSAKHGGVAEGWSLSIPTIEADYRAEATLDGGSSNFVWRSAVSGSRELIESTDASPGNWTPFRAQSDPSFARYQRYTSGVFRVLGLDGSSSYFGEENYVPNGGYPDWKPLTRTIDKYGNEVRYNWVEVFDNGVSVDYRIERIDYGFNVASSVGNHASVIFTYNAPISCSTGSLAIGARLSYRGGYKRIHSRDSIALIKTVVHEDTGSRDVRRYTLEYEGEDCSSASGPRRQLASIKTRAYSPEDVLLSMPKVSFSYAGQPTYGNWESVAGPINGEPLLPRGKRFPTTFGANDEHSNDISQLRDVNGDGRLDWLKSTTASAGCGVLWYPNEGRSASGSIVWGTPSTFGLPSLSWENGVSGPSGDEYCSLSSQFTLWTHPDAAPLESTEINPGARVVYQSRDINGDGLSSTVSNLSASIRRISEYGKPQTAAYYPGSCVVESLLPPGGPEWEPPSEYDVDTSNRKPIGSSPYCFGLKGGSGLFGAPFPLFSTAQALAGGPAGGSRNSQLIIDMNGDGYLDWLRAGFRGPFTPQSEKAWWLYQWDPATQTPSKVSYWIPEGDPRAVLDPGSSGKAVNPGFDENSTFSATSDVNGDGLPDWHSTSQVMFNLGAAGFGDLISLVGPQPEVLDRYSFTSAGSSTRGDHLQTIRRGDFNFDGRPDVTSWVAGQQKTYFGLGDGTYVETPGASGFYQSLYHNYSGNEPGWRTYTDLVDLNGDGLGDKVNVSYSTNNELIQWAQPDNGPPGSMTSIDNGRGLVFDVVYAPHTDTDVVTMGDGEMPSTHWVVETLTARNLIGGTPDSTTTYLYDTPIRTDDDFGNRGFRGFMSVSATGPTGSKSVEGYDYSLDWSGRMVSSKTYASGSTNPHTVSQTEYVRKVVNVGTNFGTWNSATQLEAFLPERSESWLCEYALPDGSAATYDEATCIASAESQLQLTKYAAGSASHINPIATFDGSRSGANIANGFLTETEYDSLIGDFTYRQVATASQSSRGDVSWSGCTSGPNGTECDYSLFLPQNTILSGRTETQYDSSKRFATRVCQARSTAELSSGFIDTTKAPCTAYDHDSLGNVIKEQVPEQYAHDIANGGVPFQTSFSEVLFDTNNLHPIRVTNPLGHQVYAATDYGTGVALASTGPNMNQASYQIIDGLGRPLQEWVSTPPCL